MVPSTSGKTDRESSKTRDANVNVNVIDSLRDTSTIPCGSGVGVETKSSPSLSVSSSVISAVSRENPLDSGKGLSYAAAASNALTPRFGSRKSLLSSSRSSLSISSSVASGPAGASTPRSSFQLPLDGPPGPPTPTESTSCQSQYPIHTLSPEKLLRDIPRSTPRPVSKCPLLCCYYAEFDNQVGPKVCFQSPPGFMEILPMDVSMQTAQELLRKTFDSIRNSERNVNASQGSFSASVPASDAAIEESIFATCSEFIISGSELTSNTLNLSSHQIHVLSRPTHISNERYERNALLFSVGFVLRRSEDPQPFISVLNQLSKTLADVEKESLFLSSSVTRPLIQHVLEHVLFDLNSKNWECHLVLNPSNILHLKLFQPPKAVTPPVPVYAVPILLRSDRHVQSISWDLAINWVRLYVDGVLNSRQISKAAQVDLDMVLSCLRVLRHHGVIALVDMFFFSNRYASTDKASAMLAGHLPDLLQSALEFCLRDDPPPSKPTSAQDGPEIASLGDGSDDGDWRPSRRLSLPVIASRSLNADNASVQDAMGTNFAAEDRSGGAPVENDHPTSIFYPESPRYRPGNNNLDLTGEISSLQSHKDTMALARLRSNCKDTMSLKLALAELYCACQGNESIGEVWIKLLSSNQSVLSSHNPYSLCIKWRRVFHRIDHRRFTSFGLVHGLLRRMHCFPMIVRGGLNDKERQIVANSVNPDTEDPSLPPNSIQHSISHRELPSRTLSDGSSGRYSNQPQLQSQPSKQVPSTGTTHDPYKTSLRVALLMDGLHCDDDLVSMFGLPLDHLLGMMEGRTVTCTYAPSIQ